MKNELWIKKQNIGLLFFLLFFTSMGFAGPLDFYYQRYLDRIEGLAKRKNIMVQTKIFNQLIDHDHPNLGTFSQRYYVDETFSNANDSPVFFFICGEAECKASDLNRGALRVLAAKYKAKLVALEHRYYGKSLPEPTFSTDHLKYLTTDLAVKDLAAFQQFMTSTNHWSGKWITIGGSYAGSLSAYYRLKYPELVAGALASSAPVMAKENFEEYDAHVTKVAGPECADAMRRVVSDVETVINNKDHARLTQIKEKFQATKVREDLDFLSLIAEVGATAIQYNMRDEFCELVTKKNADPIEGYATFARRIYVRWGMDPLTLIPQGAESENPADYSDFIGMRQWYYQTCTEYGYWQNANSDATKSTRSSLINMDYQKAICLRLFGIKLEPDTNKVNAHFYQPLLNESVSKVLFTNGSNDPWSLLSLMKENGNATNPNLDYYKIDAAAHCADLRTPSSNDSESLKTARTQFNTLVDTILKP